MSEPSDAPILILTGPPGVGKTTTAGLLAERSDRAVHLRADEFFRFIRAGYVEPWEPESHDQNQAVMRIVAEAASGYAAAGYFTIVDGIVIPGWFLEPLSGALHRAGNRVAYAVLRAPLSACIERARGREGGSLADPVAVEKIWQNFADLGSFERHAVDLADAEPSEVAGGLLERLAGDSLLVEPLST